MPKAKYNQYYYYLVNVFDEKEKVNLIDTKRYIRSEDICTDYNICKANVFNIIDGKYIKKCNHIEIIRDKVPIFQSMPIVY